LIEKCYRCHSLEELILSGVLNAKHSNALLLQLNGVSGVTRDMGLSNNFLVVLGLPLDSLLLHSLLVLVAGKRKLFDG